MTMAGASVTASALVTGLCLVYHWQAQPARLGLEAACATPPYARHLQVQVLSCLHWQFNFQVAIWRHGRWHVRCMMLGPRPAMRANAPAAAAQPEWDAAPPTRPAAPPRPRPGPSARRRSRVAGFIAPCSVCWIQCTQAAPPVPVTAGSRRRVAAPAWRARALSGTPAGTASAVTVAAPTPGRGPCPAPRRPPRRPIRTGTRPPPGQWRGGHGGCKLGLQQGPQG